MIRSHLLWTASLAALAALAASGCEVDAYCVKCADGEADAMSRDAGPGGDADAGDAAVDATFPDVTVDDAGCLSRELCNGEDDDCDGRSDEDFDLTTDPRHCGECGNECLVAHAFPSCEDGKCGIAECDVGFYDLNDDPSDGCEYPCRGSMDDDSICDLKDNDCDGDVDEDIDLDNDPANCGECALVCAVPHADAVCSDGECALGECEEGFHDIDGRERNGCEYECTVAEPPDEVCNLRDEDCDQIIDEGDPGGGDTCGSSIGSCMTGTTECTGGDIVCTGGVSPETELCNGKDDDCDETIDESNPEGGGLCGEATGTCERGREECMDGGLVCVGAVGPETESCDGLDNDCDGTIDEDNPDGGGDCGDNTGTCEFGSLTCTGGVLVCTGGTSPSDELCDGMDNDCDTDVDEGDPEAGSLCGTDVGTCSPGTTECQDGSVVCTGNVGPETETCDGQDNDCDGSIDEGNPDGGAACGNTTGACTAGTETCQGGVLVCEGGTGPTVESCNSTDDDCDGSTDEDFDLTSDVENCGSCGNVCSFDHGFADCQSSSCVLVGCESGFHDNDGDPSNGCEYSCEVAGSEICNGVDDDCDCDTSVDPDCDTFIDEDLTTPSNFCNPNGVCAGTTATCSGSDGWVCNYPDTFEESETTCDSLDNDCDGAVDEPYPLKDDPCANGLGACREEGKYVCNSDGDNVVCNADPAGASGNETCNNIDDDCDGTVDERASGDDGIDLADIATVTVDHPDGGSMEIMQYEASRPDANSGSAGSISKFACSKADVVPWTNVTWTEARDACCALNFDGTCPSSGETGWRLCPAREWETACEASSGSCTWSYETMCSTSQPTTCNGEEYDCDPDANGDQDCLETTGSPLFPECNADWGDAGAVYDMSGNAKEWTATETSPDSGIYEIRGGAYTNVEFGRTCNFSFAIGEETFAHPNTGFRCCHY